MSESRWPSRGRIVWPTKEQLSHHPNWSIAEYEKWGVPWPRIPGWKQALIDHDYDFFARWYARLEGRTESVDYPAPTRDLQAVAESGGFRLNLVPRRSVVRFGVVAITFAASIGVGIGMTSL